MPQIQPQKAKRYTACSRRLDEIKQVFVALQAGYFCDDYHRTLDSKRAERQHKDVYKRQLLICSAASLLSLRQRHFLSFENLFR